MSANEIFVSDFYLNIWKYTHTFAVKIFHAGESSA